MESLDIRCPNCGASITEMPTSDFVKCTFCDAFFKIPGNKTGSAVTAGGKDDFVIKSSVLTEFNGANTVITVPQIVEKIADGVFRGSGITNVLLPGSLKEIGAYAFADCQNLRSVVIPASVRYVGNRAFWRCSNLSQIEFLGANTELGEGVVLGTELYRSFLQSYDNEIKAQIEEDTLKNRKIYGLCPYCGNNYNIWGKCKGCGRKKNN